MVVGRISPTRRRARSTPGEPSSDSAKNSRKAVPSTPASSSTRTGASDGAPFTVPTMSPTATVPPWCSMATPCLVLSAMAPSSTSRPDRTMSIHAEKPPSPKGCGPMCVRSRWVWALARAGARTWPGRSWWVALAQAGWARTSLSEPMARTRLDRGPVVCTSRLSLAGLVPRASAIPAHRTEKTRPEASRWAYREAPVSSGPAEDSGSWLV
jgi:hypothetical protein